MKECMLSITTAVDGEERTVSKKGEWTLSPTTATILYREEDGEVRLEVNGTRVSIERTGGYSFRLYLEEGQVLKSYIGIGGEEGDIQTETEKISYSIGKDSILLFLKYALLIGGDRQEMKLRLLAKGK